MIVISKLKVLSNFKYLWLKSIKGVDLSKHCAKSLLGDYDIRINANIKEEENIILQDEVYYLCGVSKPYVWKNNFHLAFKEKENSIIEIEKNGIYIKIENAEEIEFSYLDIDKSLPQASNKAFSYCRNWQFANKYYNTKH